MYLLDTDVISEARRGPRANPGVRQFFSNVARDSVPLFISVITLGELRYGVERLHHRGDRDQARQLEGWLDHMRENYGESILPFEDDAAELWGRLLVPNTESPIDKQIAAIALLYDLTVVSRHIAHFEPTGVRVLDPFSDAA